MEDHQDKHAIAFSQIALTNGAPLLVRKFESRRGHHYEET
jgi:hypothetical protein